MLGRYRLLFSSASNGRPKSTSSRWPLLSTSTQLPPICLLPRCMHTRMTFQFVAEQPLSSSGQYMFFHLVAWGRSTATPTAPGADHPLRVSNVAAEDLSMEEEERPKCLAHAQYARHPRPVLGNRERKRAFRTGTRDATSHPM